MVTNNEPSPGVALRKEQGMKAHTHISAVHGIAVVAFVVAVFGTAHLIALGSDSRPSRALLALGF